MGPAEAMDIAVNNPFLGIAQSKCTRLKQNPRALFLASPLTRPRDG